MRLATTKFWAMLTRIFCAAALVSLAFAPVSSATGFDRALSASELATYVLPDGTLPELCITIPDGSGDGKIVKLGADPLGMHQNVGLVLPEQSHDAPLYALSSEAEWPQTATLRHLLYPPGAGPRAPPFSA